MTFIAFIAGMFVGGFVALAGLALCHIAGDADKRAGYK